MEVFHEQWEAVAVVISIVSVRSLIEMFSPAKGLSTWTAVSAICSGADTCRVRMAAIYAFVL